MVPHFSTTTTCTQKKEKKKNEQILRHPWPILKPHQDSAAAAPTQTANLNFKTESRCTHCTGTANNYCKYSRSMLKQEVCL